MNYRLRFYLRYHTYYGQDLYLLGNIPALGNEVPHQAHRMEWLNENWWYTDIPFTPGETFTLQYQYILRELEDAIYEGTVREFTLLPGEYREIIFTDTWQDASGPERALLTAPFSRVFYKRPVAALDNQLTATHIFRIQVPLLESHKTVCLLGSHLQNGSWNILQPVLLQYDNHGWFSVALDLSGIPMPLYYKYGIYDLQQQQFVHYENGGNREVHTVAVASRQVVLHDGLFRKEYTAWKGIGVTVPVCSLRSEDSFGTGEFADLPRLAQWVKQKGWQLIQVLPVNDTTQTNTWKDDTPVSAFALHPQYIRLQEVGILAASHPLQKQLARLRQWLNEKETVDYEAVMTFKQAYLKALYEQEGEKLQTRDYWQWFASNEHWVLPYAIYCYLREKFATGDFTQWPEYNLYDYTAINKLVIADEAAAAAAHYHFFVQYHLHRQLRLAAQSLHEQGIALEGAAPVGIARFSADTWMQPDAYYMDMQAGAPPDSLVAEGQNWGFPTYNWQQMANDGLEWWRQRLRHMSVYFDAVRIDYLPGFFRMWQIPRSAMQGILGYFHPAVPVSREELLQRGIDFNEDRYCRPYITDTILENIFGNYAGMMKDELLEPLSDGRYRLREELDSQRKVFESSLPEAVKTILYTLIADVLLIPVAVHNRTLYHPRYHLYTTRSFADLSADMQQKMKALYHDYFVRQEHCWHKEAMHKLPLLKRASHMLLSGENLGEAPGTPAVTAMPVLIRDIIQRYQPSPDMWRIFQIQDILAADGHHSPLAAEENKSYIPVVAARYRRYRIPEVPLDQG
ncbi:4-alpha-glucanotransferase [Chitinophaga sp. 30R24]|uniref:4-alpha-glucanotransferase n=1 Tax=Chitinophaga sp. 30R24 TaxID=3248838 RepID=UPI003B918C8A